MGPGFGGEGERRMDLLGEREREKDGEDEDLHPSQPVRVQVVYKV